MKEYKIDIVIKEDGSIDVEAHGFTGEACIKEVEELMEDVGTVNDIKKKPEFYARASKRISKRIGVGGRK